MRLREGQYQLRSGIVLNYMNQIIGSLIPVFYTPIMLRLLGQNEYGLYKLASGVTSYLGLMSMGIGSAVSRYLIKASEEKGQEEEERYLGLFLRIFRVISIAAFFAGILLCLNLDVWYADSLSGDELTRMRWLVVILTCNTSIGFYASPYISVVSAHEKFIFMQIMNIISTCVGPMLNLVILLMGFRSIGLCVTSLSLSVFSRIVYLYYVRHILGIRARYRGLPYASLKEILIFSFWIFVANIVLQLYNSTDTVMIGSLSEFGTRGVAIYNIGAVFNHIVFSLTTGVSALMTPRTNRMVFSGATDTELTDLSVKVGRLQGYVLLLAVTGFIAFGRPFIFFYSGPEYMDAFWIAVLMMVPNMVPLVQSVCLSILVAENKHRFRSLVYLAIAIVNVFGTWCLLHTSLGIVGAALVTGLAVLAGQGLVMNWYYNSHTGLDIVRFWREVGVLFIIPLILCIFTIFLSNWINFYKPYVFVLGIIIYTIAYILLNWKIIMNNYEKNLVRAFFRPFQKGRKSL